MSTRIFKTVKISTKKDLIKVELFEKSNDWEVVQECHNSIMFEKLK